MLLLKLLVVIPHGSSPLISGDNLFANKKRFAEVFILNYYATIARVELELLLFSK